MALSPTVTGSVTMRLSLVGRHRDLTTHTGRPLRLTPKITKVPIGSRGGETKRVTGEATQRSAMAIGRTADIKVHTFQIGSHL